MIGERPGRHQRTATGRGYRRTAAWLIALAVPGMAVIAAVLWLVISPVAGATKPAHPAPPAAWSGTVSTPPATAPPASGPAEPPAAPPRSAAAGGVVLSSHARRSCPPKATACADLEDHLTWLQSGGRITYGPVRMKPGARRDPTPRGIWHVAWKAGAHYISTSFGIPIPYAVFFAPGGIAFHAGSLGSSSHGCIHLRLADARRYHDDLPDGEEVVVF